MHKPSKLDYEILTFNKYTDILFCEIQKYITQAVSCPLRRVY